MKRLIVLVVSLLLLAGVAYAADSTFMQKAGGYSVTATFEKTPPAPGENTLFITITDKAGNAVSKASVKVDYYMAEKMAATMKHATMTYMGKTSDAKAADTGYKANINFSMPGPWNFVVKFKVDGKQKKANFHVNL
jgi:hypothetical protein